MIDSFSVNQLIVDKLPATENETKNVQQMYFLVAKSEIWPTMNNNLEYKYNTNQLPLYTTQHFKSSNNICLTVR